MFARILDVAGWPRRGRLLVAVLAAATWLVPAGVSAEGAAAVVFLARHAEKETGGEDPALSAAGQARAAELARGLAEAGITAVYSTDFTRTRDTAAPTSARTGAGIRIYDWDRLQDLAEELSRPGARSLVVGHSDTTPELVGLLGGDPGEPIDEPSEYDRLYVVTIAPGGAVTTVLLRYGD